MGRPSRSTNVPGRSGNTLERLRWLDRREGRSLPRGRDLSEATTRIFLLVERLDLPEHVREAALSLFYDAARRRDLRGLRTSVLVAACVLLASRLNHDPRTVKEVAEKAELSRHRLAAAEVELARRLGLRVPLLSARDLLPRAAAEFSLGSSVRAEVLRRLEALEDSGVPTSGVMPATWLGAVLVLVAREHHLPLSQGRIARGLKVTTVALRNQVRRIQAAEAARKDPSEAVTRPVSALAATAM